MVNGYPDRNKLSESVNNGRGAHPDGLVVASSVTHSLVTRMHQGAVVRPQLTEIHRVDGLQLLVQIHAGRVEVDAEPVGHAPRKAQREVAWEEGNKLDRRRSRHIITLKRAPPMVLVQWAILKPWPFSSKTL